MKKVLLLLVILALVPAWSFADSDRIKLVSVKKLDNGRAFLYECLESENIFEVQQRYNLRARAEEVRFVVNGNPDEWTRQINAETYHVQTENACEESATQVATFQ